MTTQQQAAGDAMAERLQLEINEATMTANYLEHPANKRDLQEWIDDRQQLIADWEQAKEQA